METIHNASIMNAVACTGLQLYRFGYTVSIPFFRPEWRPQSFYPRIRHNQAGGLHTLCLVGARGGPLHAPCPRPTLATTER